MNQIQKDEGQFAKSFGMMLLHIGTSLQSSGACTSRIRIILERVANSFGFDVDVLVTHRALSLTLLSDEHDPVFNGIKRTAPVGVNFKVLSGISKMSMDIKNEPWQLSTIGLELERLLGLSHYPRLTILTWVSLADASFCFIANGSLLAMAVSFVATFVGLFVRQETTRRRFNPYLCVFFAAFTATLFSGAARWLLPEYDLEAGFATSVLFLIPGVPLINSFVDIIDGNLLNGMIRLMNGLFFSMMIAFGMICSILIFNF